MEVRYRLMNNNIASRYLMLEAERSSHMLKWYIPFQVVLLSQSFIPDVFFQALTNITNITLAILAVLLIRYRNPQYYLVVMESLYVCIGPRVYNISYLVQITTSTPGDRCVSHRYQTSSVASKRVANYDIKVSVSRVEHSFAPTCANKRLGR